MKSRIHHSAHVSGLLLSLLLAAHTATAQVGGGSVVGNVSDANGAVIPDAIVTVTNVGTNESRRATTDGEGYYEFPLLPAGRYVLEVQAANFETRRSEAFDLNTGTRPKLDFTLGAAGANEQVTVTDTGQLINATNTELGVVVEQQKIDALPLNGRDFQQLVGLQAGAVNNPQGTAGGRGGFSLNGGYAYGNSILLDGVDASFGELNTAASDAGAGAPNGGTFINTVSVDAIQEFKTSSSAFSAEFGRATAGVLNITTKSGTNDFRGTLFYFLRNDVFDANSFDNNRNRIAKPALRFNQFGGNLGGPLFLPRFGEGGPAVFRGRDRLFFFFNYEGVRATRPSIIQGNVPTAAMLAQITNGALREHLSELPRDCTNLPSPDPQGRLCIHRRTGRLTNDESTYLTRVDANAGAHRLAFRYSYNDQFYSQPQGLRFDNSFNFPTLGHNFVAQDNWTLSPSVVNEVRVGFNRVNLRRNNSTLLTEPGWVETTGGPSLASDFQSLLAFRTNTYSVIDNLTYVRGRQTIKAGADIRFLRSARTQDTNPTHFYTNLDNLIADRPANIRLAFGGDKNLDSDQYAFYMQDDIRVSPRLQINPGLRYEYYTPLKGGFNIQSSDPFSPLSTERVAMFRSDKNNFAPRLGVVLDVFGDQKLVVRSGGAISYQPPQPIYLYDHAYADPLLPFQASFAPSDVAPTGISTAFPFSLAFRNLVLNNPSLLPRGFVLGRSITDYNRSDEYAVLFNATAQYAVTPSLAVQLSYVGNRDLNHPIVLLPNECLRGTVAPGSTCRRPRPEFATIQYQTYTGRNRYDAGQLSVNYRLRRNFAADFYYTYARAFSYGHVDDSLGNNQNFLQDPVDPNNSFGPKFGDQRHRIVAVHTIELPVPGFLGESRAARFLFGGFSLQGIYTYRTGEPLNIITGLDLVNNARPAGSRPDAVLGVNPYLRGQTSATGEVLWLDRAAFDRATPDAQVRYGNLGFNALRGPSFWTYDFSVVKRFRFTETQRLDFRFEGFNIFNHANLSNPVTNLADSNFGRIINRSGPRNIQFGLKYFF